VILSETEIVTVLKCFNSLIYDLSFKNQKIKQSSSDNPWQKAFVSKRIKHIYCEAPEQKWPNWAAVYEFKSCGLLNTYQSISKWRNQTSIALNDKVKDAIKKKQYISKIEEEHNIYQLTEK